MTDMTANSDSANSANMYRISLDLCPSVPVQTNRYELDEKDTQTLFAKARTIEARMSEKTSVRDLVALVEKYCMTDAWRVLVFWAESIELFYMADQPDLSEMADMRYQEAKQAFLTNPGSMSWSALLAEFPNVVLDVQSDPFTTV
jgi:hypothetical protein